MDPFHAHTTVCSLLTISKFFHHQLFFYYISSQVPARWHFYACAVHSHHYQSTKHFWYQCGMTWLTVGCTIHGSPGVENGGALSVSYALIGSLTRICIQVHAKTCKYCAYLSNYLQWSQPNYWLFVHEHQKQTHSSYLHQNSVIYAPISLTIYPQEYFFVVFERLK